MIWNNEKVADNLRALVLLRHTNFLLYRNSPFSRACSCQTCNHGREELSETILLFFCTLNFNFSYIEIRFSNLCLENISKKLRSSSKKKTVRFSVLNNLRKATMKKRC